MEKNLYCATTYQVEFEAGADYAEDSREALKSFLSEHCPSFSESGNGWNVTKADVEELLTDMTLEKVQSDALDNDTLRCVLDGWLNNCDKTNDLIHLAWF